MANIIIARDADDALRIANNTDYGLSSAVISRDTIKALDIAEKLEAGCLPTSTTPPCMTNPMPPWGGYEGQRIRQERHGGSGGVHRGPLGDPAEDPEEVSLLIADTNG